MDQNDQVQPKPVWRTPEIVDVGGVIETTTVSDTNVRDNLGLEPPTWSPHGPNGREEVDLEGR
jgi:hypothetical protein